MFDENSKRWDGILSGIMMYDIDIHNIILYTYIPNNMS